MVLDASAILAVLFQEPGHEPILSRIGEAAVVAVGVPTLVESAIVLSSRLRRDARGLVTDFLREADAEVIPFTLDHYYVAVDAFLRYGKGRHPAALNFGDCLSYATARLAGLPLIFTGDDFSKTDIMTAPPS
jgi:ribonuclease VapC